WFHNDVNIGQGIRAMLTARMAQSKNITLLEREKLNVVLKEQDFNATNRVNQGTKAKNRQNLRRRCNSTRGHHDLWTRRYEEGDRRCGEAPRGFWQGGRGPQRGQGSSRHCATNRRCGNRRGD